MAFLAIRKSALLAMPDHVRRAIRYVFKNLDLMAEGQVPPIMLSPTKVEHFVWCSPMFTVEDAVVLALIATNLDKIPDDGSLTKAELRAGLKKTLTWAVPTIPEGHDPFAYILASLNAPTAIKMFNEVPAGWTHKEP